MIRNSIEETRLKKQISFAVKKQRDLNKEITALYLEANLCYAKIDFYKKEKNKEKQQHWKNLADKCEEINYKKRVERDSFSNQENKLRLELITELQGIYDVLANK